jgi:hypothetical protein
MEDKVKGETFISWFARQGQNYLQQTIMMKMFCKTRYQTSSKICISENFWSWIYSSYGKEPENCLRAASRNSAGLSLDTLVSIHTTQILSQDR